MFSRNLIVVSMSVLVVACGARVENTQPAPQAVASPAPVRHPYTEPKFVASLIFEGGLRKPAKKGSREVLSAIWRHRVCLTNDRYVAGLVNLDLAELGTPIADHHESSALQFHFQGSTGLKTTTAPARDPRNGMAVTSIGQLKLQSFIPHTFIKSDPKFVAFRELYAEFLEFSVDEKTPQSEVMHRYYRDGRDYYLRINTDRYFFTTELGVMGLRDCEQKQQRHITEFGLLQN